MTTPRDLVALYAKRVRLTAELTSLPNLTGVDVDRVFMAGDALTAACEQYRLAHHPDAQRVVVGLYEVFAIDHDGETTRIYDGTAEYAPKEATR